MTKTAKIFYFTLQDEQRKEEKLEWLKTTPFEEIPFERLTPDKNNNWINLAEDNDWESLLPVCSKEVKAGKSKEAIFELFSLGVVTARDEWVYEFDKNHLRHKTDFFCHLYQTEQKRWQVSNKQVAINDFVDRTIKWTAELENHLQKGSQLKFDDACIIESLYRPFVKQYLYFDRIITHRIYQNENIFGFRNKHENRVIYFSGISSAKPFQCLVTNKVAGIDFLEKTQCLPLYRYDKAGNRVVNITDWGLEQFRSHYSNLTGFENLSDLGKLEIFHYVYAVLHNPAYRQKYELNLKREFPRLPFYPDFWQWVTWGKTLMELHINYETAKKYPLKRQDLTGLTNLSGLKVKLKADKLAGTITIDEQTTLHSVPETAWEYKLGNRSALEWLLDQYKEKKPSDPTIAEKFNTYRFADYKEQVMELLQRVCTVSVKTVEIIKQMGNE